MLTKANEIVEIPGYDGLIYDINPPAEVFAVKISKGTAEATYKRGTVLALSGGTAGTGEMVPLGTSAASNETLTANCILAVDVTVGTAAAENALAYRTGHFAENMLLVASGYTLTSADKEALRDVGILLSDAMEY